MADKTAKERVIEKFNLAEDIRGAKIKTSIYRVEHIDGKYKADFEINGLPREKTNKTFDYPDTSKTIPKIFNNPSEFTTYTEKFFSMSDEDIINLCKETK